MKKVLLILIIGLGLTSCQKEQIQPNPVTPPIQLESGSVIQLSENGSVGTMFNVQFDYYAVNGEHRIENLSPVNQKVSVDSVDVLLPFFIQGYYGVQTSNGWQYFNTDWLLKQDGSVIHSLNQNYNFYYAN